jgi:hypothetical protein
VEADRSAAQGQDYERFEEAVVGTQVAHPEWRLGQTFFNVLEDFDQGLADEVRGGPVDPFYNDGLIPACGMVVKERWSRV